MIMIFDKMNQPQFRISGTRRREVKKELSSLKIYAKNFWYHHQLDKDMASFYNCQTDTYPMNDETAHNKYNSALEKIKRLENDLAIPYNG